MGKQVAVTEQEMSKLSEQLRSAMWLIARHAEGDVQTNCEKAYQIVLQASDDLRRIAFDRQGLSTATKEGVVVQSYTLNRLRDLCRAAPEQLKEKQDVACYETLQQINGLLSRIDYTPNGVIEP